MPGTFRVALCQMASVHGDVGANAARARDFVKQAAADGADLIVLPEFFLHTVRVADEPQLASDGEVVRRNFSELAKDHGIAIVGGVVEHETGTDPREGVLYNVAYYVDRKGEVLCRYVKKHLWHPERDYLTAGDEPRLVFDTGLGFKCGLLMCWDLAWPEAARTLMGAGAEVIIVPTCWVLDDVGEEGKHYDPRGDNEASFLDSLVIARAYENIACVIFVNAGGKREDGFLGRSALAMPFRGAVVRFDEPDERMEIVEVDLDVLVKAEANYKIKSDYAARQRDRKTAPTRAATMSQ